jgi:hypothetical protein
MTVSLQSCVRLSPTYIKSLGVALANRDIGLGSAPFKIVEKAFALHKRKCLSDFQLVEAHWKATCVDLAQEARFFADDKKTAINWRPASVLTTRLESDILGNHDLSLADGQEGLDHIWQYTTEDLRRPLAQGSLDAHISAFARGAEHTFYTDPSFDILEISTGPDDEQLIRLLARGLTRGLQLFQWHGGNEIGIYLIQNLHCRDKKADTWKSYQMFRIPSFATLLGIIHFAFPDALHDIEIHPNLLSDEDALDLHERHAHPFTLPTQAMNVHAMTLQGPLSVCAHDAFFHYLTISKRSREEQERFTRILRIASNIFGWQFLHDFKIELVVNRVESVPIIDILYDMPGSISPHEVAQKIVHVSRKNGHGEQAARFADKLGLDYNVPMAEPEPHRAIPHAV